MKFKISGYAAVISAITFFIYSIIQLIGYGLSTGALNVNSVESLTPILKYLSLNFSIVARDFLIVILLATTLIYISFIALERKNKSNFVKIFSYTMLVVNLFVFLVTFSIYSPLPIIKNLIVNLNKIQAFFGIISCIFGISLIRWKSKNASLTLSLGVLFILQGLMTITGLFMPIRVADFTIAINVLEAVLFFSNK